MSHARRPAFVFRRRRLTYLCRKPRAFLDGGYIHAFEAARQGKTAAVTVVSDQTGH